MTLKAKSVSSVSAVSPIEADCLEKRFMSTQTDIPLESKTVSTQTDISDTMDEPSVCNIPQQPITAVSYASTDPRLPGTTSLDSMDSMSDQQHDQGLGKELAANFTDMTEASSHFGEVLRQMSAIDHIDIASERPERAISSTVDAVALVSTALVSDSASVSPWGRGYDVAISTTSGPDSSSKTSTRTESSRAVSERSDLATTSTITPMMLDKVVTIDQNSRSETRTMSENEIVGTKLAFSSSRPKIIACNRENRAIAYSSSFELLGSMSTTGMQDKRQILGLQPNSYEDTNSVGDLVNDSELNQPQYNHLLPASQDKYIQQNLHKHRDDTSSFAKSICRSKCSLPGDDKEHWSLDVDGNWTSEENTSLTQIKTKIQKRYPCRTCGMTFVSKKFMMVHTQLHGDTDPFTHMGLNHSDKQSGESESHLGDSLDKADKISKKSRRKNMAKPAVRIVDKSEKKSKSSTKASGKVGRKRTKSSRDSTVWVCRKCGFSYQTKHAFDKHEKLHSDFDPYKCGVCERGFILLHHLDKHSESHPPEDRMKCFIYAGTVCGKVPKAELPDVPLGDTGNTHQCDTCHKSYFSKTKLSEHIRRTHKDSLVCHHCGRVFNRKTRLLDHLHDHEEVKPYACTICSRTFPTAYRMKCHMSTHREVKLFPCPTCQKAFKDARLLYSHSLTHTRPFMCDACGKTFSRKCFLDDHISTAHSKVKTHTCPVCGKAFSWKDNLGAHMKRFHKGQ